jgi:hypothetical protein
MNRHVYWTAGAFLASCVLTGGLLGASFIGLNEWLHDRMCPCDA